MNELPSRMSKSLLGALETVSKSARTSAATDLPVHGTSCDATEEPGYAFQRHFRRYHDTALACAGATSDRFRCCQPSAPVNAYDTNRILGCTATGVSTREIAVARRSIAQEAIRLAGLDQRRLREAVSAEAA